MSRTLHTISHYDDDKLRFNDKTGRYELTVEYCKDEFDANFKGDRKLEKRIKLNSQVVYNYIALRAATVNKPVIAFLLERTQEGRDFLLELLSAQMYADIQTGYNDLAFQPAINFTGNDKDRTAIKQNTLCVAAEQILNESDSYLGVRLTYQGQFPQAYFIFVRQYL